MGSKEWLAGFVVVLSTPEWPKYVEEGLPTHYRGICRFPPMPNPGDRPEYPEESEAFEAAVFGDYYDEETNLIPTYDKAVELLALFSRSPRDYEIVVCCSDPEETKKLVTKAVEPLGYDVAVVRGDGWSIVLDMPESKWTDSFKRRLNRYHLFDTHEDAEAYLAAYRHYREHDWDMDFEVVYLARLL